MTMYRVNKIKAAKSLIISTIAAADTAQDLSKPKTVQR